MSIRQRLGAALYDAMMKRPERAGLQNWRRDLLDQATGTVLEIGVGTGANIANYPPSIDGLIAVEPNPAMARRIDVDAFASEGDVEIVEAYAGELPAEDSSVDTVVATLVLCSVPNPSAALAEIRRILTEEGRFLFLEHVAAEDEGIRTWQDRIDPVWHWCNGDCHMNRRTEAQIREAGFEFEWIERKPMPKTPSLLRPAIRGAAVVAS